MLRIDHSMRFGAFAAPLGAGSKRQGPWTPAFIVSARKRLRSATRMPGTDPCATTTTVRGCEAWPIAASGRLIAAAIARTQRAARRRADESWLKRISSGRRYMLEPVPPEGALSARQSQQRQQH